VARRYARVLGGDAHATEPPQRLADRIAALARGHDHAAAAKAEVEQLVDLALVLLEQHILADDADVGGAMLDIGGHVGRAHRHDAGIFEQQLAVIRSHFGGLDPEPVEQVERAV
jgi:hypothetical protein